MPYIVGTAINYPTGLVAAYKRHYKIIKMQAKLGISSSGLSEEQGFVDETGKFYTREEALPVAIAAGQVPADFKGTLYSEDIWPDSIAEIE